MADQMDRNELLDRIVERAWKDQSFKTSLLQNPQAALASMNIKIPAGMNVHVHEEKGNDVHLVIPRDPSNSELSDDALDAVAGGGGLDEWTFAC
jgi:nitrile hydratase alpha subunit